MSSSSSHLLETNLPLFLTQVENHLAHKAPLPPFDTVLHNFSLAYSAMETSGTYTMRTSGGARIDPEVLRSWFDGEAEPDEGMKDHLLKNYAADVRRRIAEFDRTGKPYPGSKARAPTEDRIPASSVPRGTFIDPMGPAAVGGPPVDHKTDLDAY